MLYSFHPRDYAAGIAFQCETLHFSRQGTLWCRRETYSATFAIFFHFLFWPSSSSSQFHQPPFPCSPLVVVHTHTRHIIADSAKPRTASFQNRAPAAARFFHTALRVFCCASCLESFRLQVSRLCTSNAVSKDTKFLLEIHQSGPEDKHNLHRRRRTQTSLCCPHPSYLKVIA